MRTLLLAAALLAFTSSAAYARAREEKPGSASTPAARAKLDRQLKARLGKKPAEIINLWNLHTHEWIVLDADEKAMLEAPVANEYFRCYFTNKPTNFDRRLLGVLTKAALHFKADKLLIVSGYRARKYLHEQMEKHFFGDGADVASGYVPPKP